VTVTGLLMPAQQRGIIGPRDPDEGRLAVLARADIDRLQRQVPNDLYPGYVQVLPSSADAPGALPHPLPPPERSEGPHRGYAGQWALFAVIWVIGYPLLVRRSAQRRAQDAFGGDDLPDGDDGSPAAPSPSSTSDNGPAARSAAGRVDSRS
jgi:cytochrome oxidase assembly protein ShyY1